MLKLYPPRAGFSSNWRIRGTYLGVTVNQSAGTPTRDVAAKLLKRLKEEIEKKRYEKEPSPSFARAAHEYLAAGGEARFIQPILKHLGSIPVGAIDQKTLDDAALELYPNASPATRNRQVYSPVIAVLSRAGIARRFRRPKGAEGRKRTNWLWPEQFDRLVSEADKIDIELGILLRLICATGLRIGEALALKCDSIRIEEGFALIPETKNGDPRAAHLPPATLAALLGHPRGLDRGNNRIFRFTRCQRLYDLAKAAYQRAGIAHHGAPFHILRHTYASWMRRYAGADERDLLDTGAWRDRKSVQRYTHTVTSEAARRADLLPLPAARTYTDFAPKTPSDE